MITILLIVGGTIAGMLLLLFVPPYLRIVKFRMSFVKRFGRPPSNAEVDAWTATWMENKQSCTEQQK